MRTAILVMIMQLMFESLSDVSARLYQAGADGLASHRVMETEHHDPGIQRSLLQQTKEERDALGVNCLGGCLTSSCSNGTCTFLQTLCKPAIGGTTCQTQSATADEDDVAAAEASNMDQQLYESLQFTPVSGAGEASDGESTFWILLLLALVLAAVGGVLYAGWKRGRRPEAYVDVRDAEQ